MVVRFREILYFEKHICMILQCLLYDYTNPNNFELSLMESLWLTKRPEGACEGIALITLLETIGRYISLQRMPIPPQL